MTLPPVNCFGVWSSNWLRSLLNGFRGWHDRLLASGVRARDNRCMRYQQLQFFTRPETVAMRDRTKARNYSAEKEEFRRDHARRRQWGLVRRHAQKLCRSHGCTGKCAEVGLHDFAEAVPPLIWPDDAIYTQRPAPPTPAAPPTPGAPVAAPGAPGAPGRFVADGRDLRPGSEQQACRPIPASEAAAARRAGSTTRTEPAPRTETAAQTAPAHQAAPAHRAEPAHQQAEAAPRTETAAHTAPAHRAEPAHQQANPIRQAEPAHQQANPIRQAEPAHQQAEAARQAGAAVPPHAKAAGHAGGPGQDEPGHRPALTRPTTSATRRHIPTCHVDTGRLTEDSLHGSAPPPAKADPRRSTTHLDHTSLAPHRPPQKKTGTIHFGANPRRSEKGQLIPRRPNVKERSPPRRPRRRSQLAERWTVLDRRRQ